MLAYYPQIVLYVFRSRFATGSQIQRRFPQHLASERTAHRRVAHLVDLGYLTIATVRSTAPYFPNVYLATGKGVSWIKQLATERGLAFTVSTTEERRERGRALDSLLHELLLTEFELAVSLTVGEKGDLGLPMTERRYFRRDKRLTYAQNARTRHVIPDAGFLLAVHPRQGSGGASHQSQPALLLHAVEMDNATMSLPRVADKLRSYEEWSRSDLGRDYLATLYRRHGAADPRANFRLLIVCHDKAKLHRDGDERRLLDVFTQALELPASMQERIWLTTVARLREHQASAAPLAGPLWVRVRDARSWLHEYRTYLASLSRGTGQKRYHRQREFVLRKIEQLPLHGLFPAGT